LLEWWVNSKDCIDIPYPWDKKIYKEMKEK